MTLKELLAWGTPRIDTLPSETVGHLMLLGDFATFIACCVLAPGIRTIVSFLPLSSGTRQVWSGFAHFVLLAGLIHGAGALMHFFPVYAIEGVLSAVGGVYACFIASVFFWRARPQIRSALELLRMVGDGHTVKRDLDRHRRTFMDAPAGTIHVGAKGEIIEANYAFARWLHTTPEWLKGRTLFDFVHPEDLPRTLEAFSSHGKEGEPLREVPFHNRYVGRDGNVVDLYWLEGSGVAVGDEALVAWCLRFAPSIDDTPAYGLVAVARTDDLPAAVNGAEH